MLLSVGMLLVACIFPLFTFFFLRKGHKDDPAYRKDCRNLLLNGMLLGFPVFGFSLLCDLLFLLTGLGEKYPIVRLVFRTFVLMAFSEELMKHLCAGKIIRKNRVAVSCLDVIAYTAIAAVGFELMESVIYLFYSDPAQILVRGVTNMHAAFGLIQGFLLSRGYRKNRKAPHVLAVLIPTIIHGLYDFGLDQQMIDTGWGDLSLLIAVFCLVLNIVAIFRIRKARKDPGLTCPLFAEEASDSPA